MVSPRSSGEIFTRDRPTVLSYGALGAYAFWLYAFGPALALLRAELHFSYAVLGLYSALWAAGAAVVGVSFPAATRLIGRPHLLWLAALGAVAGAGLFAITRTVAWTLLGAAVLGFAGTMIQTVTQSVLSDRHGDRRDRALVEANVGAGACAVLAPLALGLLAPTPPGWRAGMALPVLGLAALYLIFRRQRLPGGRAEPPTSGDGRLSLACWLLALLVAVGIGVEFCLVYFGAELLTTNTGLSTEAAAAAMSVFYLGILAGRIGGAGLTRRAGSTTRLVWISLAVSLAGFLGCWLSGSIVLALCGLFLAGLGVANLFPLCLALTLAAAPGRTDTANARSQLLGGLVVVTAPFALGALADHLGLVVAFAVEPLLLTLSGLLLWAGSRGSAQARQLGFSGLSRPASSSHRSR